MSTFLRLEATGIQHVETPLVTFLVEHFENCAATYANLYLIISNMVSNIIAVFYTFPASCPTFLRQEAPTLNIGSIFLLYAVYIVQCVRILYGNFTANEQELS